MRSLSISQSINYFWDTFAFRRATFFAVQNLRTINQLEGPVDCEHLPTREGNSSLVELIQILACSAPYFWPLWPVLHYSGLTIPSFTGSAAYPGYILYWFVSSWFQFITLLLDARGPGRAKPCTFHLKATSLLKYGHRTKAPCHITNTETSVGIIPLRGQAWRVQKNQPEIFFTPWR